MSFIILQRTEAPILQSSGGVDFKLPGFYVREINRSGELVVDVERSLARKFKTRDMAQAAIDEATNSTVGCEIIELMGPDYVSEPCTPRGFMLRALATGARSREEIRKHLPSHLAEADDETLDELRKEVIHLAKSTATKAKPKGSNGKAKTEKVLRDCHCGCGGQTFANFVVGHDARVYSLLRKEAKGEKVKLPTALTDNPDLLSAMRGKVH